METHTFKLAHPPGAPRIASLRKIQQPTKPGQGRHTRLAQNARKHDEDTKSQSSSKSHCTPTDLLGLSRVAYLSKAHHLTTRVGKLIHTKRPTNPTTAPPLETQTSRQNAGPILTHPAIAPYIANMRKIQQPTNRHARHKSRDDTIRRATIGRHMNNSTKIHELTRTRHAHI